MRKEDSFDVDTRSQDSVAYINQKIDSSEDRGSSAHRAPQKKSAFANIGGFGVSLGEESDDSYN